MANPSHNSTPTVGAEGLADFASMCILAGIGGMVYGRPGIGKSEILAQVAEDHKMALLDIRLAYMLPETTGPMYYPDAAKKEAVALKPQIIAAIEAKHIETGRPVLVLLDEITLASRETRAAALEFLLSGAIAGYRPACKFAVLAAGNRPEDTPAADYLDLPTRSRLASVLFEPSLDDLAQHIRRSFPKNDLAEKIASFLGSDAARTASRSDVPDGIEPFFTPRGLFRALQAVASAGKSDAMAALKKPAVAVLFRSMVGTLFTARMIAEIERAGITMDAKTCLADGGRSAPIAADPMHVKAQLTVIAEHVRKGGYKQNDLQALLGYLDRCQPESTEEFLRNCGGELQTALGGITMGKRLLQQAGVSLTAASAARKV
jgi:MoxR-like ATPase